MACCPAPSPLVGPLAYVEAADLIVTAGAGLELEAYKYKTLAVASADKMEPGQTPGGGEGQPREKYGQHPIIIKRLSLNHTE